jgi:ABC-type amino acid transport substrate-binding protein
MLKTMVGAASVVMAPAILSRSAVAAAPAKLTTVNPGVITMAVPGDMPMVAVRDGKVIGVDADLLSAIGSKLGLKIRADVMEWSACLASVAGGRADWVGGNTAWTPQRSKALLMTNEVYYTGMYALMRKSEPYANKVPASALKGRVAGALSGTAVVPDLRKYPGIADVKLYDTTDACIRDVAASRIDFAVLDAPFVDYVLLKDPSLSLKQVRFENDPAYPNMTGTQYSVWGMNPQNPDLYDAVNQGVAWLWKTNQIGPALQKYGIAPDDYLKPLAKSPRINVDRDASGKLVGPFEHQPKDFSSLFA